MEKPSFPRGPEHKNVDRYEREKVVVTIQELRIAADRLERYLAYADALSKNGVTIRSKVDLSKIRYPEGPAAPGNNSFSEIDILAMNALVAAENAAAAAGLNIEKIREEVEARVTEKRTTNPHEPRTSEYL